MSHVVRVVPSALAACAVQRVHHDSSHPAERWQFDDDR